MASNEDKEKGAKGDGNDAPQDDMDLVSALLSKVGLKTPEQEEDKPKREKVLDDLTIEAVAKYMKSEKCKNVVVMVGAGISTSAGIPDFRSPGSGLYDNLQEYNLPNPQSIFEIGFFMQQPEPFFKLAKALYPGTFKPTPCHYFLKLLAKKGKLLRLFSQNIDTLERVAGVPGDLIMEAHGTFHTGHCLGDCKKEYTQEWMKTEIFKDKIPRCPECDGIVKPDIVFFGESLPERFFPLVQQDFPNADLLIVMGTSLKVQPFASLVDRVKDTTPRLLINLEKCGQVDPFMKMLGMGGGMDFDDEDNYRDVAEVSTCDDGCYKLADLLGWKKELENMVKTEHDKIDKQKGGAAKKMPSKSSSPSKGTSSSKNASGKGSAGDDKQKTGAAKKTPSKPGSPSKGTSSLKNASGKGSAGDDKQKTGAAKKTPSKSGSPRPKGTSSLKKASGKGNARDDKQKTGVAKKTPSKSSSPSKGTSTLKNTSGKGNAGDDKQKTGVAKTSSKSSSPSKGTSSLNNTSGKGNAGDDKQKTGVAKTSSKSSSPSKGTSSLKNASKGTADDDKEKGGAAKKTPSKTSSQSKI